MELTEVAVDVAEGEDEELDAGDIGVPGEAAAWAGEVEGVESWVDLGIDSVDEFE